MGAIDTAYASYSDLNLWIKVKNNDTLKLSDVPAILTLRFSYIVENWSRLRPTILDRVSMSNDPSRMQGELDKFDVFVKFAVAQKNLMLQNINSKELLARYYTVIDQMYVSDIPMSQNEISIVQQEQQRVSGFNKNNFLAIREDLVAGRDAVADTIGTTDATYNEIFNRSALPQLLSPSVTDLISAFLFHNGINVVDGILANQTNLYSQAGIDPFAFARANANNTDIDINSYAAGVLVKLNYGETIQALALRTLGSTDRWPEIAIANGLKPPYIDEVGQKILLLSNGRGDQIVLPGKDEFGVFNKEKLVLNQIVILQSNTEPLPDQRVILSIQEIPISGDLVIQLSGAQDLDKYKTAENANIRIYQKNTINSNFFVLIPNQAPIPPGLNVPTPWFLRSKSQDEKNAGVDVLLNDSGDLMFTSSGDIKLSYGAENAIQAIKILMSTLQGDLFRHPDYGIANVVGDQNFQPDIVQQRLTDSIARQILSDSRFSRLDNLTVQYVSEATGGPLSLKVSLGVILAGGGDSVIPISFGINVPQ